MALFIRKKSVSVSYEELVKKVLNNGEIIRTEINDITKELRNVLIEITNPSDKSISSKYPFGENAVHEYVNQLLYGTKNQFSYDYHSRLFEWKCFDAYGAVNQVEYIIKKLKKEMSSRRALAITWNPYMDTSNLSNDVSVPCLQYIQFLIRNKKLEMSVVFRSNDILLAYHSNAIGLIALGEMIAKEIDIKLNKYCHYIISAHIYIDRDKSYIKKYFSDICK